MTVHVYEYSEIRFTLACGCVLMLRVAGDYRSALKRNDGKDVVRCERHAAEGLSDDPHG